MTTQALVPVPSTVDFEESIRLSELEEMESQLVPGGQLKFIGDLDGPSLTDLRQS